MIASPPWVLPLLVAFACAVLMFLLGRQRSFGSFVARFVHYLVLGVLLAAISLYLWGLLAPVIGLPRPAKDIADVAFKDLPAYSPLWIFQSAWILLVALNEVLRRKKLRPYDLFISYHPNDVAVAKGLADRLILSGRKVWFRPYERDHLARVGSSWPTVLLKAIGGARWGLALVSDDYTATLERQPRDFWELNGEAIFHHKLSEVLGSRLIEVRIPGRERRPAPAPGSARAGQYGSSQQILDRIAEKTGWKIPRTDPGSDILRNRLRDKTAEFDFFISYKSHDVDLVRPVVDRLIASGLNVWFAEYQILLQDRDKFGQAILDGIANSAFGLAFTNNRYIDSEYCQFEIERLLERPGPGRILEVKVPDEDRPHQLYPALGASPGEAARSRSDMLRFISDVTGFAVASEPLPAKRGTKETFYTAACLGRPVRLNTTGWRLTKPGKRDDEGSTQGLEFKLQGRYPLAVNLYSGPETSSPGQRQDQDIDDRRMYDHLLEYAPRHLGHLQTKPKGVHLFFHRGLSQMALTYWMEHYWTRKYSLVIPNPATREMAEFLLTFGFIGSFEEYCLHTSFMDDFARSLDWL
jgi:hypothetical protein